MATPDKYQYIEKENEWQSPESPFTNKPIVGGLPLNSLVDHPYREALSKLGVPVGLVMAKEPVHKLTDTSMVREIIRGGGGEPAIIADSLYDQLFDKISVSRKPKQMTRKKRD